MAFMASSTVTQRVTTSENAIFNKVEVNFGQGYEPLDGKFTCQNDGIYLFYFSLHLSYDYAQVKILVDGQTVFLTRAYKYYPSGTFMLKLEKGQEVYMKFNVELNIYGNDYTWFGGHLIREF